MTRYEKHRESIKAAYYAHREERLAYAKRYRETHKEEMSAKNKAWRENNRERYNAYQREYKRMWRAKKKKEEQHSELASD